jgi:hypothetical protein
MARPSKSAQVDIGPDEIVKSNSCSNGSYMNDVSLSDLPREFTKTSTPKPSILGWVGMHEFSFGHGLNVSSANTLEPFKVAMSPLTSVFGCLLGDDVPYDDSVCIRLDNQALLRSGWRSSSNSMTSC